ncbi:Zinc finger, C3HC-like protein [Corchorus capsularis]|uniref:Zinc finger, C3HC-like protein n=1 Tax=Corchorus capsularis TaxID=210143 RepID=A0A1R3JHZ1_COCAP|nr:Zinc finger, C3HC-like protein [Corchorus capsularis]
MVLTGSMNKLLLDRPMKALDIGPSRKTAFQTQSEHTWRSSRLLEFQIPEERKSSPGGQLSRGKKRPNPLSALAIEEPKRSLVAAEAPLCRPWDRGDLLRRLSTFKSMTWFAKPKVVSAVNCARRGWVNVDMDIIACESCGARLLFSTPPSWTQQQVEKAALVFSLKLDSGHKLLCPWIDVTSDERLVEFPPTMPADLVDKFRERFSSLFQLSALPVISSSAIECMRSPQLEEFLRRPLTVYKENNEVSQSENIEDEIDVDSANLYYQAQKLISLYGWEPRSLPYVVDYKDGSNQFVKDADILKLSQGGYRNQSLSFHSVDGNKNLMANKGSENSCGLEYDPKSVVLDCKLCGASVGLWAYSTVQRPVEFIRLVGYAEVNPGVHDSGHESNADNRLVVFASNGGSSSLEQSSNLKLTIAGGPPPTRQNFKATISLPVIGQSLRARLSYHPEFRDRIPNNQEDTRPESEFNIIQGEVDCVNNSISGQVVPLEGMRTLDSKEDDQLNCNNTSNDQSPHSNPDVSARDDIFRNLAPLEGTSFNVEEMSSGTDSGAHDHHMGGQIKSFQEVAQGSCPSNKFPENVDHNRSDHLAEQDSGTQNKESSATTEGANFPPRNAGTIENDSSVMITSEKGHPEQIAETDKVGNKDVSSSIHQESTGVSYSESDIVIHSREDNSCSDAPIASNQEGMIAGVQMAENNKLLSCARGKDPKQLHMDKTTEFDPIRQHRHFCPWIASASGMAPGWQQTLSALLCQKDIPHSSPTCSPSSASMIEVDDPILSVRNLFASPIAKRMKTAREST